MEYCAPETLAEVCAALSNADGPVRVLAGGTDLLARFASGMPRPSMLVDIKKLAPARVIRQLPDGSFEIGAACPGIHIRADKLLGKYWPGLSEAMDLIGSVQIQGRATLGGNLCNASPAADAVPALIAARAHCRVVSVAGQREVPVEEVIISPGRTCLRQDEFIVSFILPARASRSADAYLRMTPRTEMDIAIAGVAVNLTLDDSGVITDSHVALGAVGPVPVFAVAASRILLGSSLDEEVLQRFRRQVSVMCRPISDKRSTAEYRTDVTAVLAARAARIAYDRAAADIAS
ncbi:MAG: xanthine dehydrogenase family protein subunit M [Pseudohongiella sp.]|nr:xanthine dehydrogenase family protein subunit M [Pseudohongiella sp.]